MGDDTTKIFLNASGTLDDVSQELKAFLDYVAGKKSEDSFVEKLEEAVKEAKKNREWRHEYMTLLMRDQENQEKGKVQERHKIIMKMIRQGFSVEQIVALCETSKEEIEECKKKM